MVLKASVVAGEDLAASEEKTLTAGLLQHDRHLVARRLPEHEVEP
jgi:hypothetical protein